MADLRVGEHLGEVVDGAAGDVRRLEGGDPRGGAARREEGSEDRHELHARRDPRSVRREPRVARELRTPGHLAEPRELRVVPDREHEVPVRRREGLVRDDGRVGVPEPAGRDARREEALGLVRERRDLDVEEREVHVLPLAGAVAVGDGREHRGGGVHAGEEVGERDPDLHGPPPGTPSGSPVTLMSPPIACTRKS